MKKEGYLKEWFLRYVKNRDIFFKKIKNIEEIEDKIIIEEKTKKIIYYVNSDDKTFSEILTDTNDYENKGLLLYNTEKNFNNLFKEWKKLINISDITIFFINPFSKTEQKWIIHPNMHHKISDEKSLKSGLKTLFDTVELLTEKEIKKLN